MSQKILPILSAFLLYGFFCQAQKYEFGLGLGGASYSGDLYRGYDVLNQKLGVQGLCRINTAPDISWKFALTYAKVAGDDGKPFDVLGEQRGASFERSFLEASAVFEYHFLDYKHDKSLVKWSPFAFAGVGMTKFFNLESTDNFSSYQPVVPFGLGFKHLIGKQFTMSVEYGARKTFFDQLDGVSDGDVSNKDYQFGNPANDDWYHFVGVTFSYILYKIPCTYRYVPNRSMH